MQARCIASGASMIVIKSDIWACSGSVMQMSGSFLVILMALLLMHWTLPPHFLSGNMNTRFPCISSLTSCSFSDVFVRLTVLIQCPPKCVSDLLQMYILAQLLRGQLQYFIEGVGGGSDLFSTTNQKCLRHDLNKYSSNMESQMPQFHFFIWRVIWHIFFF